MQDIIQEVVNRLDDVDTRRATLRRGDFEGAPHAGGSSDSVILDYKARQPIALRQGGIYRVVPVARETFTTDGSGTQQTFNLSHNLIDSDVSDDLVLYADGAQAEPDSVDYAADSFDYTDGGAAEDLTVFYVAATQASIKLKKVGPGGSNSETLVEHDVALINRREPNRDPLKFTFDRSPIQGTVPKDWHLKWEIDGPFNAGWDPETDPAPVNMLVSVPINRATVAEVEGLSTAVGQDTSNRV
ncbi:hypothetical protein EXE53_15405 [Halorubrum sp. SD626R]|uniref:hypothetical protein n=1 Tax=Halorubrum sp. SD626R TaxID=1419722 RepID=UPI0010F4C840|nr:hypothetical protein [Halorubrum sp. SD626R]TKX79549.1 hypothetical protein EXE53_15405 [Halorubrum sp. SD626R]